MPAKMRQEEAKQQETTRRVQKVVKTATSVKKVTPPAAIKKVEKSKSPAAPKKVATAAKK